MPKQHDIGVKEIIKALTHTASYTKCT